MTDVELLATLETFYDAVPRDRAVAEEHGGLVLFVPLNPTQSLYARPRPDGPAPTAADLAAVRARQRALGLCEALEWVHEVTPDLLPIAEDAGYTALRAPLMVLDAATLPPAGSDIRLLSPYSLRFATDLALCAAVAAVGFGEPLPARGSAGPAERDAALRPVDPEQLRDELTRTLDGRTARVLAETAEWGAAACGQYQRVGDVVELVGVATLPVARQRGLASTATAALAQHALDSGASTVFLSASGEAVARIYAQLGFRRVGTACIADGSPMP